MDIYFSDRYKKKLLETFRSTAAFLNHHKLRWWAAYGTAIGAVRHHNIIPWDDDIDICMFREDYNKLLGLKDELNEYDLNIISAYDNVLYGKPFSKICNKNTTVMQRPEDKLVIGLWVDVFPVDYCNGTKEDCYSQYLSFRDTILKYTFSVEHFTLSSIAYSFIKRNFSLSRKKFLNKMFYSYFYNDYYKEWIDKEKRIQEKNGDWLVSYGSAYGMGEIMKPEWFDEFVEAPFADFTVKIPSGYDAYLKNIYGDYMTPPSPLPALSHSMYYVNLEESRTIEQVRNDIKNKVSKPYIKVDKGNTACGRLLQILKKTSKIK